MKRGTILNTHSGPEEIIARYGGEEFVMILRGVDALKAEKRAEEIRVIAEQYVYQMGKVIRQVTCSVGVAMLLQHAPQTVELMTSMVDTTLYEAQKMRNRVAVYGPGSDQ